MSRFPILASSRCKNRESAANYHNVENGAKSMLAAGRNFVIDKVPVFACNSSKTIFSETDMGVRSLFYLELGLGE